MLLSASQVSGLITSVIVLSCTVALFLSGYAVQQRTVNQLRAAIKQQSSRPSPKPYLPDRFRATTTELEDGTIVTVESDENLPAWAAGWGKKNKQPGRQQTVIEIQPSLPEGKRQQELLHQVFEDGFGTRDEVVEALSITQRLTEAELAANTERERNLRAQMDKNQLHPDPKAKDQKPISRAERRRLIKQEIQRLSYDEEPVYYQRRLY